MNRPIYEMLQSVSHRLSCHMPGHKGKSPFGSVDIYSLDTTELPVTDDLYCPESAILEAQQLYSLSAGSSSSIFLHNGSTAGVQALVQLYCNEGDSILLCRNAHMSAVNGCAVGGIRTQWIPFTLLPEGYCTVTEENVLSSMKAHPECKAVLLTRPDFYGCCINLERISALAKKMNMKLIVDEAHGAHLPWLSPAMAHCGMTPVKSSGCLGADAWVQSVHKTLPGLTGSAVLHLKNADDHDSALRILRRTMTSSPNFCLLMSIDDSRAFMDESGCEKLEQLIQNCSHLKTSLPSYGYSDGHEAWIGNSMQFDPTRIVIKAPQGGKLLAEQLAEHNIDVEMWDNFRVVMIFSPMDNEDKFKCIHKALKQTAPQKKGISLPQYKTSLPPKAMEVRQASFAGICAVPFSCASGRIAAQSAGLYPPGIPLIVPGEIFTDEIIAVLASAKPQERFGTEGDCVTCVNV